MHTSNFGIKMDALHSATHTGASRLEARFADWKSSTLTAEPWLLKQMKKMTKNIHKLHEFLHGIVEFNAPLDTV